jgi:large subunit ribosomal protein L33
MKPFFILENVLYNKNRRGIEMKEKLILVCDECLNRNYTFDKNKYDQNKFSIKKFCPHCNKHTKHIETK